MNEDTIERLELKIAFLKSASAQLSEVLYAQQRQIDTLKARVTELAGRLESFKDGGGAYTIEEEKPPHY